MRIEVSVADLHAEIDAVSPTWRSRAAGWTADLAADASSEVKSRWSEIKPAYEKIQGSKCAYCEQPLEAGAAIVFDVEHFRPKNAVTRYRTNASLRSEGVSPVQPASGKEPGYRLLAYEPLNYVLACKQCNSSKKGNKFPIAGVRNSAATDVTVLAGERPLLIYPLGEVDDRPEDLIRFEGLSPQPTAASGHDRHRALVTMHVFSLDDTRRKGLFLSRADVISKTFFVLAALEDPSSPAHPDAPAALRRLEHRRSAHANCVRCFVALWRTDRAAAVAIKDAVHALLDSHGL